MSDKTSSIRCLTIVLIFLISVGENACADFTFGEPTNLGPRVNTSASEAVGCISFDGLEMYLDSPRSGGQGGWDLWVATREAVGDQWGTPMNLGPTVNSAGTDVIASISANGLELYFNSNRSGGYGNYDIWVSRRPTRDDAWGTPVNLGSKVNTSGRDMSPSISANGLELYFAGRNRTGGYGSDDIWMTRRATKNDPWESPTNLGPVVNTSASEATPCISPDGLVLFFNEDRNQLLRPGGYGALDIWVTRRTSISSPWGTPVNLGPVVNTASLDSGPRTSPDGSTLYFTSDRPGGFGGGAWADIYQAPIIPIVEFNGDGIVNSTDMCLMVDHWRTNEPLYDIGPMPWGDGVVDVQDLIILSDHLLQEVSDPTLVANWALDESEGAIAVDSVTENNGNGDVIGDPLWLPSGGKVNGAIQLDGVDDAIVTGTVLNPGYGPFSVLVWIRGGAAGQTIISQSGGSNWLSLDPLEGRLMTELSGLGRSSGPLQSETFITDGNWHRIGFVWDGMYRMLYLDGIMVAQDTQDDMEVRGAGMYIGTGSTMAPGTYFSGLIDDVRIYNRAVSP